MGIFPAKTPKLKSLGRCQKRHDNCAGEMFERKTNILLLQKVLGRDIIQVGSDPTQSYKEPFTVEKIEQAKGFKR